MFKSVCIYNYGSRMHPHFLLHIAYTFVLHSRSKLYIVKLYTYLGLEGTEYMDPLFTITYSIHRSIKTIIPKICSVTIKMAMYYMNL